MRLVKHPGRPVQPRRQIAEGRPAGEWRVSLAPGADVIHGLTEALAARGVGQAALQLLGGDLDALQVQLPEADGEGGPIAVPGAPRSLACPAALLGGNGILGSDAEGRPCLHCHAVVVDAAGRVRGGRLVPGACRVGAEGLVVQVAALAGAGFLEAHDAETDCSLFQPVKVDR